MNPRQLFDDISIHSRDRAPQRWSPRVVKNTIRHEAYLTPEHPKLRPFIAQSPRITWKNNYALVRHLREIWLECRGQKFSIGNYLNPQENKNIDYSEWRSAWKNVTAISRYEQMMSNSITKTKFSYLVYQTLTKPCQSWSRANQIDQLMVEL